MAHLTPLALQLTNSIPSDIDNITSDCCIFFKINCPAKWLAEEYIKVDSTFDKYLDTLKRIGKKKSSMSAICTNLYRYYQSSDGQKQLKLLKRQRTALLSKEIAKSSTHGGVYDDIDYDNIRGRNVPWSDNQTSAKLNEEAVPKSGSSSEHSTTKETAQVGQKHPRDPFEGIVDVHSRTPREVTPPRDTQRHHEEIPLAADLEAVFRHVDVSKTFLLRERDQNLYDDARKWYKAKIRTSTEMTIAELRKTRFELKLLNAGLNPNADENTYTSFWVSPDLVALQTGVKGLISSGFINENHFTPSAWRRSLARGVLSPKGTNVDGYFLARDEYVDILLENIGSPSCTNHSKHHDDKEKMWRNAADALLERFYNTIGSFEIAKGYKIVCIIVFGHEVTIYTVSILNKNEYLVEMVLRDKYHFRQDVYLAKLLLHLRICLTIKSIMEDNLDVCVAFGNSIEDTEKDEQAHFNLRIHTTP
ncbi:hypothetical protein EDD11_005549, partial [Mortierella claussenii]